MKNITFLTTARSDFGLLKNLITEMNSLKRFKVSVIATGSHFSKSYGNTYKEILNNGIKITKKIETLQSDKINNIGLPIAKCIKESSTYFENNKPDILMILGDRYEALAIAISAHINKIPIAHIHGGELTQNLMDDAFRHSITKLSQIHFVANKIYKKRVIQLGENPKNVFVTGALGIEAIKKTKLLSKNEIEKKLKIKLNKKIVIVTLHPETLDIKFNQKKVDIMLDSIKSFKNDVSFIFTSPGADVESNLIKKKIAQFIKKNKNSYLFKSLRSEKYYSLLKISNLMLGNSSSGILEMPYFNKTTVNIGSRQKGRLMDKSVINVAWNKTIIKKEIHRALYQKKINKNRHLFGSGKSTKMIIKILSRVNCNRILIKKFNDII